MTELAPAARSLATLDIELLMTPVLVQLIVIVAVARLAGVVARRLGQPTAVGEIIAGLLLGPSLFGWLAPEWSTALFRPELEGVATELSAAMFPKIFQVLAQIGLIFLLFIIGLEFEFAHLRTRGAAAISVSLAGVAVPFTLGVGLALAIHSELEPHPTRGPVPLVPLVLFTGVAMSITAIPILGRILMEFGVNRTKLAAVVISAAAVDDACGWVLLASVAAVARATATGGTFDPVPTLLMIGHTLAFGVVMLVVVRPLLIRYFRHTLQESAEPSLNVLAVVLVVLFLSALATNLIGIFAIFGAFILGAVLSDQPQVRQAIGGRLRDLVNAFFLPIFFTYTGLRTQVDTLSGSTAWLIFAGVMGAAVIGKFGGCALAARFTGLTWRESALVGSLMNTRALMELIVINVGYDLGVIPPSLFAMLVLMAIITTVMTTPIVMLLSRGTEFEWPLVANGYLKAPARTAERT